MWYYLFKIRLNDIKNGFYGYRVPKIKVGCVKTLCNRFRYMYERKLNEINKLNGKRNWIKKINLDYFSGICVLQE